MHAMFWLPVLVDLRGAHHHVATARPHQVEHIPEREPALDELLPHRRPRGTDRKGRTEQHGVAVGEQQIGFEVDTASRTAIIGIVPMGLARISPSSRHASAQATTQTSANNADDAGDDDAGEPTLIRDPRLAGIRPPERRTYRARNASHASGDSADAAYSRWNASSRS